MMPAAAFDQWCHRLGLGPETRACLARLRAAPPVRRVQGRAQNVSGTYASRKMGMTIQFESHKVELWAIYAMEYDAGTGSVCCRSTRDLHLSSFLYQEYLLEGEALFQHS